MLKKFKPLKPWVYLSTKFGRKMQVNTRVKGLFLYMLITIISLNDCRSKVFCLVFAKSASTD